MKHFWKACLAIGMAGLAVTSAQAQAAYPSRVVRIIVPAPAGTGPDVMARLYAEHLGRSLGQSFVVEDRPGASGNLGADAVAHAPADGYTLLYAYNQIPTMNPHLFSKLSYDPVKDLVPISQTLSTAYVLLGNNDLPAKDLAGIIDYARKNPGKLAYASYGPGTASHLVMELIQDSEKVQFLHVPYKQGQVTDVIGGQVAMVIEPFPSAIPMVKSGKVRALAVTTDKRIKELPDAPTMSEAIKGLTLYGWQGVWAPAGTPPDILAKLQSEFARITKLPDMQKRIADFASVPIGSTGPEMASAIQRESQQWGAVIRDKRITLD
jgi:tripartite-type tricarboxylate transporter receptor subunit TctC